MKKNKLIRCVFFICITLLGSVNNLYSQKFNAYKFIEPNVSISYDTNLYKFTKKYIDASDETEAYDVELIKDSKKNSALFIEVKNPGIPPTKKDLDNSLFRGIQNVRNENDDSFLIVKYDTSIKMINNFSCIGFTGYNKFTNTYTTYINCYNYSNNENTQIKYYSINRNSLEMDYKLITPFIQGYRNYSSQEINKEDNSIKAKYSVVVNQIEKPNNNLKSRGKTYTAVIKTIPKYEFNVKEVIVYNSFGKEAFKAKSDGSAVIFCNDKEKGKIEKYGEFIVKNSFGKNVKIPFSFSYVNK